MAILDCRTGKGHLLAEHERVLRGLSRKDEHPELREGETLTGAYHPQAMEIAAKNWRLRMAHEHRSAQTFTNLLPHLVTAGASMEFKTVVVRSALDELRHATLCGQVVSLLGHDPTIDVVLTPEKPTFHPDVSPVEAAIRNLGFVGCISETVAVGMLTEERDKAKEPFVKRVLTQLLADETLHARVGWAYLREEWPSLDAAARERTTAYLARALGYYEQCVIEATLPGVFSDEVMADAIALGFSEPRNALELAYQAIDAVVVPELEKIGVPVGALWNARKCSD
ncbi:MAG: hypothetical protein ACJAYU_000849 [Bradymonadia bacterium]|jgi:hypothetical protein